jgi:hypothetical protein
VRVLVEIILTALCKEFDTPLKLFNKDDGFFRSLCEKSNITSSDIEKANTCDDME